MRYSRVSEHPSVFRACTGLTVKQFDELFDDVLPLHEAAEVQRLYRPDRQRAIGGGKQPTLDARDQLLMSVVWLRLYPTNEVLGYLFGVSDSSASRVIQRVVPVLEQAGRDTMRMPDPGRKHRREMSDLLHQIPDLVVVVDTFEQRVQKPPKDNSHFSGKKKQHTLKSQVSVDGDTGQIVEISDSRPGPIQDISMLRGSGLLERLPEEAALMGDLGFLGMDRECKRAFLPRRKPRGKERPPEDIPYNHAFSQYRIVVEHTIGKMRRYQRLSQTDRHHRRNHAACVVAVAGLVNRKPTYALS